MRNEYPRPDFVRDSFVSLDKEWDFDFDDKNLGHKEKWFINHKFTKAINVPFCFQSKLSGINDKSFHDHIWYQTEIKVRTLKEDERVILYFLGVDYYSETYINGFRVKDNYGANVGFEIDITDYLIDDKAKITIYVNDPSEDRLIPRGKQDWEKESHTIFYTRTSGIYKPVYYQIVNKRHIKNFFYTTSLKDNSINLTLLNTNNDGYLKFKITDKNDCSYEYIYNIHKYIERFTINLPNDFVNDRIWRVEYPYLFNIELSLFDENMNLKDIVKSYLGFRDISISNGKVYLNEHEIYQKLVLFQGYYEDGILTPKSIDVMENDIKMMKELGFNGCRIHQKTADPYFLYLCDKLGFYVWQECAANYGYSLLSPERQINEWIKIIKFNYNHPSIIAYTPLNESWGVEGIPQDEKIKAHAMSLYYLIKSLDDSRLVISNDGWEHCKTDLLTIHNYSHGNKDEIEKYKKFEKTLSNRDEILKFEGIGRFIINPGFIDEGQPILLTEFGGVALNNKENEKDWGYTTSKNEKEFIEDLKRIYKAIKESNCIVGYCYTQFNDVEQEVNGLVTYDRKYKVNPKLIKEINDSI
ncbi:MAG: glycoside hydrolase family 2 [Firmicutes bacterium]|uniref:Glycoside hydrolase family 2 n=1 Tax=Candidatus Onthovivens merdipullorum TaxID=2840889 RepID=A0A9D9DL68_9BACL|nr:glycoside hydrolase family 2 [Candidatus Onthovivens merdipullorum]